MPEPVTPNVAAPPNSVTPTSVGEMAGLFAAIWSHRVLVAAFVLLGLLMATLVVYNTRPMYESEALLLVVKQIPVSADTSNIDAVRTRFEDDVQTHTTLMMSPKFITEMVDKHSLVELPSFQDNADAVRQISQGLLVSIEGDNAPRTSSILRVAFTGRRAEDCPTVVNAAVENYRDFLKKTSADINENAITLITGRSDAALEKLEAKRREYQDFRDSLPVQLGETGSDAPDKIRLASIETRRTELRIRRAELEQQMRTLEAAIQTDTSPDNLIALLPVRNESQPSSPVRQRLITLIAKEKTLSERYGSGYPELRNVREEISLVRLFANSDDVRDLDAAINGDASDRDIQTQLNLLKSPFHAVQKQDIRNLSVPSTC